MKIEVEGEPVHPGDVLWLKWDPKTAAVSGRIRLSTVSIYGWTMYGSPCQYPYTDLSWTNPFA
jgi:hypothetical protein